MTLDLFGSGLVAMDHADGPALERRAEAPEASEPRVIPPSKVATALIAAGWPPEQRERLLDFLESCVRIPTPGTTPARGCPRYVVRVHHDRAELVEAAYAYDPVAKGPKPLPREQGHPSTFWRDDVPRPWVRAVVPAQREAS